MMVKTEITTLVDIKTLVDKFYEKVRNDELLKDIFNDRIQGKWPKHLEKMYRFWQTVLLDEHTYSGSPFLPHASMPIEIEHFNRWIELFGKTLDENFNGEKAKEALKRAKMMAAMFHHKIEHYKNSTAKPIK
ncbi:MAG: group III truncated hemoglobin [Vicingaceae bacterium]